MPVRVVSTNVRAEISAMCQNTKDSVFAKQVPVCDVDIFVLVFSTTGGSTIFLTVLHTFRSE